MYFVGNKAKEWISKQVLQENQARQIFRKTNISDTLIRTRTRVCQGVRNVRFSENLACLICRNTSFEIRHFALLPTTWTTSETVSINCSRIQLTFNNTLYTL